MPRVNYPDLDWMKLLMALFVVEIHTRPFMGHPTAEAVIGGLEALAVPFFFIASAFLCFRGLCSDDFATPESKGSVRVRRTTGKLLRLYLIWTALFLPVTVFGDLLAGKSLLSGLASFIKGTLFVGENFCSWPLWYLRGSVIGFVLTYLILRGGGSSKHLLFVSASFLFAGYLLTLLHNWDGAPAVIAQPVKAYFVIFENTRNGLFEGFFYIAVGAVLGMKHEQLDKLHFGVPVAMAVLGIIGCILISNDAHLPFCACASICVFLLSVRRSGENLKPYVKARNSSTIIYLVHMYFVVIFVYLICGGSNPKLFANEVNRFLLYLFALGGSTAVSVLVITLAKRSTVLKTVFGL